MEILIAQSDVWFCRIRTYAPLQSIKGHLELITGDLTQPESLKPFFKGAEGATLFHSAGIVHPNNGVKQFYDVNVQGTQNLIDGCRG